MNLKEYKVKISELEKKHKEEFNSVHIEYAKSNNPYEIGDIIKDHCCRIKIEKISVTFGMHRIPYCVYYGILINKDGSYNKKGKKETIYQTNIKN